MAPRPLIRACLVPLMSLSLCSCFAPPDGRVMPKLLNYPPVIDLETARPAEATFDLETGCGFTVSADVSDPDDDELLVRLVADNRVRGRAKVIDSSRPLPPAADGQSVRIRGFHADFSEPGVQMHSISLFVTDAPRFLTTDTSTASDLGEIDPFENADDAIEDYAVVELRWGVALVERQEGSCP